MSHYHGANLSRCENFAKITLENSNQLINCPDHCGHLTDFFNFDILLLFELWHLLKLLFLIYSLDLYSYVTYVEFYQDLTEPSDLPTTPECSISLLLISLAKQRVRVWRSVSPDRRFIRDG